VKYKSKMGVYTVNMFKYSLGHILNLNYIMFGVFISLLLR